MYIVAVAWIYVVVMMTIAEATSKNGTVLGALFTFLLYGVLPLSIVLYLMGTPMRRKARRAAEQAATDEAAAAPSAVEPDGAGHAAGDAVATIRKEP
jgi:NADH:ubiquinone oxidoreductase subunit 6 (subunit J)